MQTRQIGVMVVEDHAIVRQGLRAVIGAQDDMSIVAETDDVHEAVPLFASAHPDVVLMDLRFRNGSGLEAIRALSAAFPHSRTVVLSNYSSEEHVFRAVAAGAQGYVLKEADPADIVRALRTVHGGHRFLSAEASASLADHVHRSSLTAREHDVLELLARGTRNREIAGALRICEETVKGHVKNILSKLNARARAEAAREAIRRGIVDVD